MMFECQTQMLHSLTNVHGHSTFLLALGQNPNLLLHSLTNHQHTHHQIQAKY